MGYSREEMETVIVFDEIEKQWNVYTCCPRHITKYLKLNHDVKVLEYDGDRPIAISFTVPENCITVRNIVEKRELTPEQKEQARFRMQKLHQKQDSGV